MVPAKEASCVEKISRTLGFHVSVFMFKLVLFQLTKTETKNHFSKAHFILVLKTKTKNFD